MIDISNIIVGGFVPAIKGIRNSYSSWAESDSYFSLERMSKPVEFNGHEQLIDIHDPVIIGEKDYKLAMKLARAGEPHCKYRRMIIMWADIDAPLYFWKQFDTYKVGTVSNSTSTMHNITDNEFDMSMFSVDISNTKMKTWHELIGTLNNFRRLYKDSKEVGDNDAASKWFNAIIAILPESYNQKRTICANYSVLASIYNQRRGHKLSEWRDLIRFIEILPYSYLITGKDNEDGTVECSN